MRARESVSFAASVMDACARGAWPCTGSRSSQASSAACATSKGMGTDDTFRAVARMSYPRSNEPRPAALPPETRTVGQVIAESIRIYGESFFRCLFIGIPPALLTLGGEHLSRRASLVLTPTVGGALLTAAYVYASIVVLRLHPPRSRIALAWIAGWLVFIPAPFLLI